ncbi:MAG: DUF5107 domain-containing protein [Victivallales bacterium]|nr:DUF5107 domain-containing protein [Victivallales bacterium]
MLKYNVVKMQIPTYPEPEKEKLPMYCENRCHQRTSGRVYPNAVINGVIRDRKIERQYTAIVLENDYLELIILPEIGGRIFGARDKTNNYDFFYRQHVIKPALIGLLGSWISGGAEFNWPMHHRPSTYLPTDFSIEEKDDSITVWLSEHEPLDRMKGMVGIKLCKDKAGFETCARVFNRTELPQSFLWWENIAVPVNEDYQIFFPQDVNHVNFHRKQSVTEYPLTAPGMYNGKDYRDGQRDIRWHKNTRGATSYFSARSNYDFFGGFDHDKNAGVVHVANHHISPGKKLFTWAYDQLSQSWEKALTDSDGAYAELMAGVYSDNQPDFSWLEAGEVKEFSQFWYPIKELGEPLNANSRVAFNFSAESGLIKIYAAEDFRDAAVKIYCNGELIHREKTALPISRTTQLKCRCLEKCDDADLRVSITEAEDKEIISFCRADLKPPVIPEPRPADPSPRSLDNPEDLYLTGLHMTQYRDALTKADVYWKRALELNPRHYQSLTGLGLSALREFRLQDAENYFREAIAILTAYNPNPRDGEAYYQLGLALKQQGKTGEAYNAFYKSVWNFHWRSQGYYQLAALDCIRNDFDTAKAHLRQALDSYAGNQKARNLLATVERKLGNSFTDIIAETLKHDPLDYRALNESGKDFFGIMSSDPSQTILDIVFEYTGAGFFADAAELLRRFTAAVNKVSPMILYTLGWTLEKLGRNREAEAVYTAARNACPDYCFPARLEEMQLLQHVAAVRKDRRAAYYLGNLLYGKEQYDAAFEQWRNALAGGEEYYVLFRNLGMACYNNRKDNSRARKYLRRALEIKPDDPQLLFEYNYLLQLTNAPVAERIALLEKNTDMLKRRDDLYLELIRAYNQTGNCRQALSLFNTHNFTPCEGGEHAIIEQYSFAHYRLGREALRKNDFDRARKYFHDGQIFPKNLGAGIWNTAMNTPCKYYEAQCLEHIDRRQALAAYRAIADMGIDLFSYMYQPGIDCYRALALKCLGKTDSGNALLRASIKKWEREKLIPDYGYFKITPFFISYLEDQANVRKQHYDYLLGLAYSALGKNRKADEYFSRVLDINSGHLMAALEKSMLS